MARENRPVLGTVECSGCGGVATVHQTARGAGRYLYTRCPDCGADQRTGAKVQSAWWRGAVWRDGAPDVPPPNLLDEPVVESVVEPVAGDAVADVLLVVSEPDELPEEPSKSGLFWLVGGAVGLVALVLRGGV